MSASFRTISFTFEAVRGEYLSRTQRATQRPAILFMLQMEIYGKPYVRRIYIYITCVNESFFTAYLLCIFFSSFRCKLQFSSSFAADKDGWNGETYHSALYSLVIFYRTIFFLLFIMENILRYYGNHRLRNLISAKSPELLS